MLETNSHHYNFDGYLNATWNICVGTLADVAGFCELLDVYVNGTSNLHKHYDLHNSTHSVCNKHSYSCRIVNIDANRVQ